MRHRPALLVAMMATVIAGGCARKPDDAALASSIRLQLAGDSMLKDADLAVSSSSGAVTLSGTVASDAARKEAFRLASQTRGVASVNDEMSVEVAQAPQAFAPNADSPHPINPILPHTPREKKKGETTIEATESRDGLPRMLIPKPAPVPVTSQFALQSSSSQLAPITAQTTSQVPGLPIPPPAPPAPPQPKDVVVPVNSMMRVRMIDTVDSAVNGPGEIFHAALESPMVVDGTVVVPRGTDIYVRLASSKKAGRLKGKSELH
ncbi:MAG: BON domain-containing protein, partial [Candidatus Acidiferrales bacterium]